MQKDKQLLATIMALGHWPAFQQRLFLEGTLVGVVSGTVISFFRWALEAGTRYREYIYTYILETGPIWVNFAWFVLLLAAAYVLWRMGKYEPEAGGSGIPQVKGIVLGAVRLHWFRVLWVKLIGGILGIGLGISLHSASIPSFKTFFRYFVHHTRWYCREYTYPLPYESSLLLILNIFFFMFLSYHMQEHFVNICSAFFKKIVRLTHHYYNIFMGNPLTSSKDLSISLLKLLKLPTPIWCVEP